MISTSRSARIESLECRRLLSATDVFDLLVARRNFGHTVPVDR